MTKLMEWLAALGVLTSIWIYLLKTKDQADQNYTLILFSPIVFVGLFGIYALSVVLYRVMTFNDCKEAAAELKLEIEEARTALIKEGFKFKGTK